ncbi:hypothetical protein LIER_04498 [Lithospermum erythrorhizon]|uniref:Uncharacterized protein n=1 Tax=Lithospermum erythrorhizon TaxID=34254 RepID=A0AAV3NXD4_LITER
MKEKGNGKEESSESWKTESEETVKKSGRASGGVRINEDRSRILNKRIRNNVLDVATDVKEFIVNLPKSFGDPTSPKYFQVIIRKKKFIFSAECINELFGRENTSKILKNVSKDAIASELIGRLLIEWPKGGLKDASLSRKYAVLLLHKKGSSILVDHVLKHLDSHAVALSIGYRRMICGVLLNQYPKIVKKDDVQREAPEELITNKLLKGTHVAYIIYVTPPDEGSSKSVKKKEKDQVQDELNQVKVLISVYVRENVKLDIKIAKLNAEIKQMESDPGLDEDEDVEIAGSSMQVWNLD